MIMYYYSDFTSYTGGGNGNPLQYSCLGNPIDRGTWQATVHGVTKESDMTKQLKHVLVDKRGN